MTPAARREAFAYVTRIRNRAKADYAMRYLNYLQGAAEPETPPGLSYMGAQAVRLALRDIVGECPPSD